MSIGADATITPVMPPSTKVKMKPSTNSNGVFSTGRPSQRVAIQQKIWTPLGTAISMLEAVKKLGIEPDAAEISMLPQNYLKLEGKAAQQMVKLMEALDDHDDVQHVWANFDIEEKEIEASLA